MAMAVGNKKGAKGDINVTPLIDIVLVLLIIFMVLVPSMLKELTANVPKKDKSDTPPDPTSVPIVVEYTARRSCRSIRSRWRPSSWPRRSASG